MTFYILFVMSGMISIGSPTDVQVHVEGVYLTESECNTHKLEHTQNTAFCVKAS